MLSGHPHIKRLRFQENLINGQMRQTLVVETDINLSDNRTPKDEAQLSHLQDFLKILAVNDFADFNHIEIRPHVAADREDDYGNNMVA